MIMQGDRTGQKEFLPRMNTDYLLPQKSTKSANGRASLLTSRDFNPRLVLLNLGQIHVAYAT